MLPTEVTMGKRRRHGREWPRPAAAKADGAGEPGRFSARRKTETILRLLRGEPLDGVARELGVTAATLAQWREQFLARRPGRAQEPARRRPGRRDPAAAGQGRRDHDEQRAAPRPVPSAGGGPPFSAAEAERMSQTRSPSTQRVYGLARVCRVWEVARSTVYAAAGRAATAPAGPAAAARAEAAVE